MWAGSIRMELPAQLSAVHNIFHVSQLQKCLRVPEKVVDIEKLQLKPDLIYPGSLEINPATSIRCNGVITPSEKLSGKRRNLSNLNILICYRSIEVYNCCLLFNLALAS